MTDPAGTFGVTVLFVMALIPLVFILTSYYEGNNRD